MVTVSNLEVCSLIFQVLLTLMEDSVLIRLPLSRRWYWVPDIYQVSHKLDWTPQNDLTESTPGLILFLVSSQAPEEDRNCAFFRPCQTSVVLKIMSIAYRFIWLWGLFIPEKITLTYRIWAYLFHLSQDKRTSKSYITIITNQHDL